MTADVDSLTVLLPDCWPSLISIFKGPKGSIARSTIKYQIINKERFPDFPVVAYAPYSDPEEGIIFLWRVSNVGYEVSIFSMKDDIKKLVEALKSTTKIDWRSRWLFCAMEAEIEKGVREIIDHIKLKDQIFDVSFTFYITRERALTFNIEHFQNIRLEIIGPEYAKEIDDTWPHRYPGSLSYFQGMLERKSALGIFGAPEGDLRGWIFCSVRGDMHALHIKTEHRRKGYAQILIKVMSKIVAEQGIDIFSCIVTDNTASQELFTKLGFQYLTTVTWIDGLVEN